MNNPETYSVINNRDEWTSLIAFDKFSALGATAGAPAVALNCTIYKILYIARLHYIQNVSAKLSEIVLRKLSMIQI